MTSKHAPSATLLAFILSSCAADFSPDPYNQTDRNSLTNADAGRGQDGGKKDAAVTRDAAAPARDAESTVPDGAGEVTVDVQTPPTPPAPDTTTTVGCDLSGKWLMTEHFGLAAFGTKQNIYNWYYVELSQEGDVITFTRSLSCGDRIRGLPPFEVTIDDSQAWPSYAQHPTYEGRKGKSSSAAGGCTVSFDKAVTLRGATPEAYLDLSVPLPMPEEQATESQPGWEDWDEDGNPGITLRLSGVASGTLYASTRTWTQASGTIASDANTFVLPVSWNNDRAVLGSVGSSILFSITGTPDADTSRHMVELARLDADQASGDAAALCARVRELAPTLTPTAAQ